MAEKLYEPSSSEDTDASEDNGNKDETWDVMILHAQPLRAQAINMTHILNDICGLRVSTIDRCAPPNKLELEGGLRVMRRSTMVVVLAGGKVSRDLRYWISNAVKTSVYGDLARGRQSRARDAQGSSLNGLSRGTAALLHDGRLWRHAETGVRHLQGLLFPRQDPGHGHGLGMRHRAGTLPSVRCAGPISFISI